MLGFPVFANRDAMFWGNTFALLRLFWLQPSKAPSCILLNTCGATLTLQLNSEASSKLPSRTNSLLVLPPALNVYLNLTRSI
eukprot:28797-Amphidinium_carterae.2